MDFLEGAAGAAIVESGAGAGDGTGTGTGDGGAGPSGPGTGAPAPEGGGPAGDGAPVEGDGGGEGEPSEEGELGEIGDEEIEGLETDGRKIDQKTREAIAQLKKTNPDAAKRVAESYHRFSAIMKDVNANTPSEAVNKVRQMAATIDSLGGEEGISDMQQEVSDYRNELQQFANGDVQLLKDLHAENAEAYARMTGNALELLAEVNPKALDNVLLPTMVARLERAGFYTSIKSLAELIKEGKGQESYDLTAEIASWLQNAKGIANKQITLKSEKNPEREALDAERRELDQQKRQNFDGAVGSDVNKQNNTATARIVDPFFNAIKLRPEGRREFVNALNSRIYKLMKDDKGFQRAAKSIIAKGDQQKASRFIHAKFAELLPSEFRKLRDAMYPNYARGGTKSSAGAKAKVESSNGTGKPAVKATPGKVYARSEVDIQSTPDVYLIVGKAYLKGTTTPVPYDRESSR